MNILLNGQQHNLEQAISLEELILSLELEGKFAVEINQNIISRSEYSTTRLNQGDNIEIVQAIGGG